MENLNDMKLEKSYRRSAFVSFIGILIVLATLIYSSFKLYSLQKTAEVTKKEIQDLDELLAAKRQQLDTLLTRIDQARQSLNASEYRSAKIALDQAFETAKTTQISAQIYIHIRDESQRTAAQKMKEQLQASGYLVPGIERLVEKGPKDTELRYFHPDEAEQAGKIVDLLTSKGFQVQIVDLSDEYGASPAVRPGHYELWLSPGVLPKKTEF